ncbi:MAG: FAD-binding oxidoreductase [Marinosulfonomonas sp.]
MSNPLDAQNAIAAFRAVVGDGNVLTAEPDTVGYTTDWTGAYATSALAVVRPGSTQEVAQVIRICSENGIAVVPQGGRTGICGGGVPVDDQVSVVLSLVRMNKIRSLDTAGRSVVVEAGVILENLHHAALDHDLVFPLVFGAKGSCTIGGNLATNAGGSNVVRYGNTRELCLGVEAVMADGSIVDALTGLRKDNTGYDLKDLLIGSEGTLGVITAAVFKLHPKPIVRTTAFLSLASLDGAIEVLNDLQDRTGGCVEAFEYMPAAAVDVICKVFPDIKSPLETSAPIGVLVEVASSRKDDAELQDDWTVRLETHVLELLAELMEKELVLDAVVAQSEQQREALWKMRESILESLTENGPVYHLDISLPLGNISQFVDLMDAKAAELGFKPITVGHLGDGNLHYALTAQAGQDWDALPLDAMKKAAYDLLKDLNGSFSAEHGIGQSKLSVMSDYKQASQLQMMRAIKAALDPMNIMNPGKLVPPVSAAK